MGAASEEPQTIKEVGLFGEMWIPVKR